MKGSIERMLDNKSFEKKKEELKLYRSPNIFLTTSDWVTDFIEMLENQTIVFTMFQTVVNNS